MATDRSLTTLLRALQTVSNHQDSTRLLASATVLLRLLSNPRNISLLTSQLLCAPAIWQIGDRSRTAWRVTEAFTTAASHILRQDDTGAFRQTIALKSSLPPDQWISAVLGGIGHHIPSWKQVVLLGALLRALNGEGLSSLLDLERGKLSLNLASTTQQFLQHRGIDDDVASATVVVVFSSVFNSLDQSSKALLRYEELLPLLYKDLFFGQHGLHAGYFLSNIDNDVVEAAHGRVQWPAKSQTFQRLREMSKSPIVAHLGPLSSLLAYAAASVSELGLIQDLANALFSFSRSLNLQWRQNKLSEIAFSEETSLLTEETLQDTLPALWQILRVTMSAIIVILRSVTDRMLFEPNPRIAQEIASNILFSLRNLYFISFRLKINLSSHYTYVYLASIDVLSQAPHQAQMFLGSIKPLSSGVVPSHPLDRYNDLCFLNIAEHLTAVVPTSVRTSLLLPAALPYLGIARDSGLIDILEAAHSVVLSTFATSDDVNILETHIGSYVDTLFQVFPAVLSPRQFRLAIKTLVRLTAPPAPIAAIQPLLSSTLLEVVRFKLSEPSSGPRSPSPSRYARSAQPQSQASQLANDQPALSEQAVYGLAMIDSIPYLPLGDVRDWLQFVAESLPVIVDGDQRLLCQARIWEVLSSGELDLDHSAICVRWWTTEGGKEMVLGSPRGCAEPAMMSGALVEDSRL